MKKISKLFLGLVMVLSVLLVNPSNVSASSRIINYNPEKTRVDVKKGDYPSKFYIYFDIKDDNNDEVIIQTSDIYKAMNDWMQKNYGQDLSVVPGVHFDYEIFINNESQSEYKYVEKSLVVTSPKMSGKNPLKFAETFDGQELDLEYAGYRLANSEAIYKGLFNVNKASQVTYLMMLNMYDYLTDKGYTGTQALTDYLLNYYNTSSRYNADGIDAKTIDELDGVAKRNMISTSLSPSGSYSVSYKGTTREALLKELNENEQFNKYAVLLNDSGTNIRFRLIESEPQLASLIYNYFYDECQLINYGEESIIDANGTDVSHSISKYYFNENGVLDSANKYLKSKLGELKANSTYTFYMEAAINGPYTGNTYQNYNYNFNSYFTLKKVKDYNLKIHYIDEETNDLLGDNFTHTYKEGSHYDMSKEIMKEFNGYYQTKVTGDHLSGNINKDLEINVYYKPYRTDLKVDKVDDKNNPLTGATFTLYKDVDNEWVEISSISNESKMVFKGLLDGTYYLKEIKVPTGYKQNDNVITLRIQKGIIYENNQEIDKVTVTNHLIKDPMIVIDDPKVPDSTENGNTSKPMTEDHTQYAVYVLLSVGSLILSGIVLMNKRRRKIQ